MAQSEAALVQGGGTAAIAAAFARIHFIGKRSSANPKIPKLMPKGARGRPIADPIKRQSRVDDGDLARSWGPIIGPGLGPW